MLCAAPADEARFTPCANAHSIGSAVLAAMKIPAHIQMGRLIRRLAIKTIPSPRCVLVSAQVPPRVPTSAVVNKTLTERLAFALCENLEQAKNSTLGCILPVRLHKEHNYPNTGKERRIEISAANIG